jgi:uncharacterized membrane protein YGL010W
MPQHRTGDAAMTSYAQSLAHARAIDVLLAQYGENHRHPANERIHFVCIPAIVFSLLGLLWAIHPAVALAVGAGALWYYFKLSPPFALGMLGLTIFMLVILAIMPTFIVLPVSIALFVVAWIGQFIGHQIEGRKPAFFDDLRFLLIGPLFVLRVLYRRLGVAY